MYTLLTPIYIIYNWNFGELYLQYDSFAWNMMRVLFSIIIRYYYYYYYFSNIINNNYIYIVLLLIIYIYLILTIKMKYLLWKLLTIIHQTSIYICIQQQFVLNDLRYHKNHFNLSTYINIYTLHVLKKRVMNYND